MRMIVLVLRLIYVGSAVLSTAAGALVTASLFIGERAPHGTTVIGISLVVSGVFLVAAIVLAGIQRHVAALAAAARGPGGASAPQMATHVGRLVGYLVVAGACVCVLLAGLTYGIVERIGQGVAVFG